MSRRERRRAERRTRSVRLRFVTEGEEHRAVTTSVSATGAFVKAAHIPLVGARLTLREVYNAAGAHLRLVGEVMWTLPEPALDRPDTGFGLRFIELATREDPSAIEDFVRYLDPATPAPIPVDYEERADGVFAVHRFDPSADADVPEPSEHAAEPEFEEVVTVDLARELDRLDREQARAETTAGDPRAPSSPAPPPAPEPPPEPPRPRERSRRRTVTGIFTALFGRRRDPDESTFDHARDQTPPLGDADRVPYRPAVEPIHDAHLQRVGVRWSGATHEAGVWALDRDRAILRGRAPLPPIGEIVGLIPREVDGPPAGLALRGRVVGHGPGDRDAVEYTVALEHEADPRWRADFEAFLRLVNGP